MKNTFLAVAITAMAGLSGIVPRAVAAPGDKTTFSMVRAAGATCLSNKAHGRVTIDDLGPVQNMHVEVFGNHAQERLHTFCDATLRPAFRAKLVSGGNFHRQEGQWRGRLHGHLQPGNFHAHIRRASTDEPRSYVVCGPKRRLKRGLRGDVHSL
jgi:hypothetical protein